MRAFLRRSAVLLLLTPAYTYAQQPGKKPLDHTVYDGWQSIGAKTISNDGKWVAYVIQPQEGDATLVVTDSKGTRKLEVPRGITPSVTEDSKYVLFTIKPLYKDTRQARIKKKKPDEMPRDTMAYVQLGSHEIIRIPQVKTFKTPEKGAGVIAYTLEKPKADTSAKKRELKGQPHYDSFLDADDDKPGSDKPTDGSTLVIWNYAKKTIDTVKNVTDFTFSKPGNKLLLVTKPDKKDSLAKPSVMLWDIASRKTDILNRGAGNYKFFTFDEEGRQVAYLAERDSAKAIQKSHKLYYYAPGADSAVIVADNNSKGIPAKWGVSENGSLSFSKDGKKLFFGTSPVAPPKDTNIVDFEVAKVDVWHYQDDYLQTQQLKTLDRDLKKSFTAVYYPATKQLVQLADRKMDFLIFPDNNNGPYALGYSDYDQRIALQWTGKTLKTLYLVNTVTGERKVIKDKLIGLQNISPEGKFINWFDLEKSQHFAYEVATGVTREITTAIPTKLADEENDVPDFAGSYGAPTWLEGDKYLYVNDRYDIWQVDPQGKEAPVMITGGYGRKTRTVLRYVKLDKEEKFIRPKQSLLLSAYNDSTKYGGYFSLKLGDKKGPQQIALGPYGYLGIEKAVNADMFLFQRMNYVESPDVYAGKNIASAVKLSAINPQQKEYNWGTAELFKWTTFSGKQTEGILYKPEDFDPSKKYPVLFYFYEKLTDGLYGYQPPAPTPSRLNISFFVSRGYLVLAPDISYEIGHPGESAYDYIVSGAEALTKNPWADKANMGIQGQSWGGYQVAYLVTRTNMFKAAWAGAPVANMTSAYGGIRWESGMNRQFQYEHTQSRIGATLWEKPELYIENSPLFHLPKVNTPMVIMANDADGAVPWYQGIELFTGLRRLGKPVWMLNYNNEAHNLVQRQNRKDIQVREQQFFDHMLKGAPAAQWIKYGLPATDKGRNWGFENAAE
ncbi:prolyl oligopeptidase family serine peptidase [Chitinophaga horti]|uniref:Prolyl oligopeptidase family serine peptidase n=1 Tax=Chitinophaga horti TaxID=2920382 RepID=A0ABY6IZH9_9BACT|nr:prolyl oligopeptidase family serine peptidase [Chitinophaga horti]UYQ91307.1 prolyl oligopeptidase family serine peptidase [Chitinophaga horti]